MDVLDVSLLKFDHRSFSGTILFSGIADRGLAWSIGREVAFQSTLFLFTRGEEARRRCFHFLCGVVAGSGWSGRVERGRGPTAEERKGKACPE
jgi:hypothetical protein